MEFLNFIVPFKIFFRKRIKNLRTMKSFYFSYTVFFSKCGVWYYVSMQKQLCISANLMAIINCFSES